MRRPEFSAALPFRFELPESTKIKSTTLDYIKDSLQGRAVYAGQTMYVVSRDEMDGILDNIVATSTLTFSNQIARKGKRL